MARIMRSAFSLALLAIVNAQVPSMSPFPSALPPFKVTNTAGGAEPGMLSVNAPNTPVDPFAPPPGPMVVPVPPEQLPMPTSEPVMGTYEPMMGTAEPMMTAGMDMHMGLGVGVSPEPSLAVFQLVASPDVMPMISPEPSMPGMMMPSLEPNVPGPAVVPVPPVRTPPVTRCPSTCRLSVGANAQFNIDSPQDVAFSGPITGPNFVTALEVGEATVDGRPVSTYGLPATTFGIWPIGLTNKFGVGHRTVEMRDRAKLYDRCVTIPVTRYISGTTDPRLVNSMNTALDCVTFYLTPKQPAPVVA